MEKKVNKLQLSNFELGRKIRKNNAGKMRIGTRFGNQYIVCYYKKLANPNFESCMKHMINEANILRQLDHPNIIKIYEFRDNESIRKPDGRECPVIYSVLEYFSGFELFDLVEFSRFPDKLARYVFKRLISAVEYLNRKGYAHFDIKLENILVDSQANIKLIDFSLASPLAGEDGSGKSSIIKGSMSYMSPEIFTGKEYSVSKVDIFSLGVVLFSIIAQSSPFRKAYEKDAFYKLFCTNKDAYWTKISQSKPPGTFSPNFISLINIMLEFNPDSRATIATIKAHPWFNEEDLTLKEAQAEIEAIIESLKKSKEESN